MIEASSPEIPMTLDNSVMWNVHSLEKGTLYLPQSESNADTDRAVALLAAQPQGKKIGEGGSGGEVYLPADGQEQDIVIKEFYTCVIMSRNRGDPGDLSSLRANVMIAHGLDLLDQSRALWRIKGVRILGALVFDEMNASHEGPNARWIMERAVPQENVATEDYMPAIYLNHRVDRDGRLYAGPPRTKKAPLRPAMPTPYQRAKLYTKALVATGVENQHDLQINADDHARNMIIEQLPEKRRFKVLKQGLATKIDIEAIRGLDF